MAEWQKLGGIEPESLKDMRLQIHFAAMITAAPAHSLTTHREDFSEDALSWREADRAMQSEAIGGLRVVLFCETGEIGIESESHATERFVLEGLTVSEARRRLAKMVERAAGREFQMALPIEDYGEEMPAHALGRGEAFAWQPDHAKELLAYYQNAATLIQSGVSAEPGAAPMRIWPHHLDIASLITYQGSGEPCYIGLGMSPGDESYGEPYFYVNPWPYPDPAQSLPALPAGAHWHNHGWTGAVLPATELIKHNDQQRAAREFVDAAVANEKKLLQVK